MQKDEILEAALALVQSKKGDFCAFHNFTTNKKKW